MVKGPRKPTLPAGEAAWVQAVSKAHGHRGGGRTHWDQEPCTPADPVGWGQVECNDYKGTAVNECTFKYQPDLQVPPT